MLCHYRYTFSLLDFLFRRFLSIFSTMLLVMFPRALGFHFSRNAMISVLFLDFLRTIIFSPSHLLSLSHPLISRRVFARAATRRPISCYPLTCRRFFTRDTSRPPNPPRAHAILTIRRTLESHKALRRIFHAAISASRDERRYSS